MLWTLGSVVNLVIAVVYGVIFVMIARPLIKTKQLRTNPLGTGTAFIFLTCMVHHGGHFIHGMGPSVGIEVEHGLALREAWTLHAVVWDAITAAVGIYYLGLRKSYPAMLLGAQLYEDVRQREDRAVEINDNIVQGLATAKFALDVGREQEAVDILRSTLISAQSVISDVLGTDNGLRAGALRRSKAASLR